jgi:hypothetical protein
LYDDATAFTTPAAPMLIYGNHPQSTFGGCVISQHVGQLRGRIEGFCALHPKLWDFFALLLLKPKSDRISLREGMVNSQSVNEIDMTSFDLLLVGNNED